MPSPAATMKAPPLSAGPFWSTGDGRVEILGNQCLRRDTQHQVERCSEDTARTGRIECAGGCVCNKPAGPESMTDDIIKEVRTREMMEPIGSPIGQRETNRLGDFLAKRKSHPNKRAQAQPLPMARRAACSCAESNGNCETSCICQRVGGREAGQVQGMLQTYVQLSREMEKIKKVKKKKRWSKK